MLCANAHQSLSLNRWGFFVGAARDWLGEGALGVGIASVSPYESSPSRRGRCGIVSAYVAGVAGIIAGFFSSGSQGKRLREPRTLPGSIGRLIKPDRSNAMLKTKWLRWVIEPARVVRYVEGQAEVWGRVCGTQE